MKLCDSMFHFLPWDIQASLHTGVTKDETEPRMSRSAGSQSVCESLGVGEGDFSKDFGVTVVLDDIQ